MDHQVDLARRVTRTTWNILLLVTLGFILCFRTVCSFNLEPRIPVIKLGDRDTYFGFSVAQHIRFNARRGNPESRILVGAPKALNEQPGTNVTGAIFDCPLNTLLSDCKRISIDDTAPVMDDESKDDQWLGVTVKSQGPGGYVMACAHRYVKKDDDNAYRFGNGICYSLTQELDYDNVFDPCQNRPVQKAHEQFGYCQAGTSGAITEDNNIVIGTPGPYTWRGTVFINTIAHGMFEDYTWYYGPLFDHSAPVDKYSYLGMSVIAARFSRNEISFVAGAPRANNSGQVVFFRKIPGNDTLQVQAVLNGELFASSFGYEVGAADLNGDRLPDLIVGAPFYYDKNAGGAIYVYLNSKGGITRNTVPTRITGKPDSRFGISIANCSDLNKDGYEDIAVGAPYEGNGAVYIYFGSKNGIQTEAVQVIKSEDLPRTLRTFGHSLSGGLDLDGNKYPDLIVGAYENDAVVLLRARPIISLVTSYGKDVTISPSVKGCKGDRYSEETCFSVKTCFKITSKEALKTSVVTINYTLEAETFQGKKISRVIIKGANENSKSLINNIFTLSGRDLLLEKCQDEVVYLRKFSNTRHLDILTPVSFKVTYTLVQDKPVQPRHGSSLPDINNYPILNQQEASKIFKVPFEKDCGPDDICVSDLDVKAYLDPRVGPLLLGEMPNITVNVLIRNKNESAYEAAVYIFHPESVIFSRGKVENTQNYCQKVSKTAVICNLDNPFKALPEDTLIKAEFGTSKVKDSENALHFLVTANSTSVERYKKMDIRLNIDVKRKASLSYKGMSVPEQVKYGGKIRGGSDMKHEDDVGTEIEHTHILDNKGPWHISSLTMTFHWPIEILEPNLQHGKRLLYLLEQPVISQAYGRCNILPGVVNPLGLTLRSAPVQPPKPVIKSEDYDNVMKGMTDTAHAETERHEHHNSSHEERRVITTYTETRTSTRVKSTETSSTETRSKREIDSAESASLTKPRKAIVFECNRTATCIPIQCTIEDLRAGKNVVVRMRARLWNSTFVSEFPTVDTVQIITPVDINLGPIPQIDLVDEFHTRQTIKTSCLPDILYSQLKKEIPYWVYILAACIGILLLILIIICLWKLGFFKRKHQKEMMKGNLQKNANEYQ